MNEFEFEYVIVILVLIMMFFFPVLFAGTRIWSRGIDKTEESRKGHLQFGKL